MALKTQVLSPWEDLQIAGWFCWSTHWSFLFSPVSFPGVSVPVLAQRVSGLLFQSSVEQKRTAFFVFMLGLNTVGI